MQLAGYVDHFDSDNMGRIIGYVEYTYLQTLTQEEKNKIYDELLSHQIPCIVFGEKSEPDGELLKKAEKADTRS